MISGSFNELGFYSDRLINDSTPIFSIIRTIHELKYVNHLHVTYYSP